MAQYYDDDMSYPREVSCLSNILGSGRIKIYARKNGNMLKRCNRTQMEISLDRTYSSQGWNLTRRITKNKTNDLNSIKQICMKYYLLNPTLEGDCLSLIIWKGQQKN